MRDFPSSPSKVALTRLVFATLVIVPLAFAFSAWAQSLSDPTTALPDPTVLLVLPPSPASGTLLLSATVKDPRAEGELHFVIDGNGKHDERKGTTSDLATWRYAWNTADGWPNGRYRIQASYAFERGIIVSEGAIDVMNTTATSGTTSTDSGTDTDTSTDTSADTETTHTDTDTDTDTDTGTNAGTSADTVTEPTTENEPATETSTPAALSVAWVSPAAQEIKVSGAVDLRVSVIGSPESVGFFIKGGSYATERYFSATPVGGGAYALFWSPGAPGEYVVRGVAKKGTSLIAAHDDRTIIVGSTTTEPIGTEDEEPEITAPETGQTSTSAAEEDDSGSDADVSVEEPTTGTPPIPSSETDDDDDRSATDDAADAQEAETDDDASAEAEDEDDSGSATSGPEADEREEPEDRSDEIPEGTTPMAVEGEIEDETDDRAAEEARKAIAADCAERGIPAEKCEDWLAGRSSAQECRAVGITTREECLSWLRRQSGGRLPECLGMSDERCAEAEQRKTAGLPSAETFRRIDAAVADHIDTVIRFKASDGTRKIEATSAAAPERPVSDDLTENIPLRPSEEGAEIAVLVHASPAHVRTSETGSSRRTPAVLFVDTDKDGLPDDVERRLGTDPLDADSDDDGFDDATETRNGYDPLGPGRASVPVRRAPIDAAIIGGLPIEQPSDIGEASDDLSVDAVGNVPQDGADPAEGPSVLFEGRGVPGEVVTIFVYSYLPVVLSTTVGEDGTWAYALDDALADGKHEAYVTVTDETGRIAKKSSPLSFFVAEARAATEEEYFGANADLVAVAEAPVTDLYRLYGLGAAALIVVSLLLGVLIFRQAKQPTMME